MTDVGPLVKVGLCAPMISVASLVRLYDARLAVEEEFLKVAAVEQYEHEVPNEVAVRLPGPIYVEVKVTRLLSDGLPILRVKASGPVLLEGVR